MAPSRAMRSLLAMPPTLRHLLVRRTLLSAIAQRQFATETSPGTETTLPGPRIERIPYPPREPRDPLPQCLSFVPPPSNDPHQTAVPSEPPKPAALEAATKVFTAKPPQFLHSAPRFMHLPVNTRTPEVCVIGRSNVGKSTLINALAGKPTHEAGRASGYAARRDGMALTSPRAGHTRTMNMYGFSTVPQDVLQAALKEREEANKKLGSLSRSERREAAKRPREKLPWHGLILVDMPGYGFNSLEEWGVEIAKYLKGRQMLKGAVVLIDAVAGVKDDDKRALRMLRDAGTRTMVVLTKGDKLEYAPEDMDKVLVDVWKTLRRVEGDSTTWREGEGWEPEIWVTGAGDPRKSGGLGVEGARFGICLMTGLLKDRRKRRHEVDAKTTEPPKIVSFDEIFGASTIQEPKTKGNRRNAPSSSF